MSWALVLALTLSLSAGSGATQNGNSRLLGHVQLVIQQKHTRKMRATAVHRGRKTILGILSQFLSRPAYRSNKVMTRSHRAPGSDSKATTTESTQTTASTKSSGKTRSS